MRDEPQFEQANNNYYAGSLTSQLLETIVAELSAAELEVPAKFEVLRDPDVWICDSGASCHSTNNSAGAVNVRASDVKTYGHHGDAVPAEKMVDIPCQHIYKDGTRGCHTRLTCVKCNKDSNFNLFSLSRMLVTGWHIKKGDENGILIGNDKGDEICFDIVIKTAYGAIYAGRFIRKTEISAASVTKGVAMNVNKAHSLLGHGDEESTRATARHLGWTITRGALKPCVYCARSKARQKNVTKESKSENKATEPGGRLFLDLTKVTVPKSDGTEHVIGRKYWKNMVDEASGMKWADFTTTKNGMVEPTIEFLTLMKANGVSVKVIRMDPGGENMLLKKELEKVRCAHLQPIKTEITSRDTPQHNSLVEVSFPTMAARGRAAMNAANVPDDVKPQVCIEAIKCVTQLDSLRIVTLNDVSQTRVEHVFGKLPGWAAHLRTWGEAGVVAEGKNAKIGDRGTPMMFVGYSGRESDSYRMWNPSTNRVVVTRDIIWLKRMYYAPSTHFKVEEEGITEDIVNTPIVTEVINPRPNEGDQPAEAVDDDEEENEAPEVERSVSWADQVEAQDDSAETVAGGTVPNVPAPVTTRFGRVSTAPERLLEVMEPLVDEIQGTAAELRYISLMAECDNDELRGILRNAEEFSMCDIEFSLSDIEFELEDLEFDQVGAGIGGGYDHTDQLRVLNYREAMRSKDREEWIKEIKKEYERFEKFKVFKVVKREDLPKGAKVVSGTWAFKFKSNGDRRGRYNARGYEQVEGQHYVADSISSPVTNQTTIRLLLFLWCCNPFWVAEALDVVGAFLQGIFQNGEVMYSEVPDGMEPFYGSRADVVLLMLVPIYGTKQAANCFYETFVRKAVVESKKYQRSKADPCLYYTWHNGRLAVFASWIDDLIIMGHPDDVAQIKSDVSKVFECKDEGKLVEYVGTKLDFKRGDDGIGSLRITQPVLIDKLKDALGAPKKPLKTPALAQLELVRGDGSGTITDPKRVTWFRSLTAICMYLMQWSRPDIQNATRGLARMMSAPRDVHVPALERLVHYLVCTPNRGLFMHPNRKWDGSKDHKFRICGRSDSNYAANTDDRRSVSGTSVKVDGCPVIFRSNTQKYVTLSVTEAELGAGVTCAQDMMHIYRIMTSLDLQVELPMVLEMDNKGAVDAANNHSVGGRTRHMDVRMYFLRELKAQGLLVIKHLPGDDNDTDIFTKNTATPVFLKHLPTYMGHDEYMEGDAKGNNSTA